MLRHGSGARYETPTARDHGRPGHAEIPPVWPGFLLSIVDSATIRAGYSCSSPSPVVVRRVGFPVSVSRIPCPSLVLASLVRVLA